MGLTEGFYDQNYWIVCNLGSEAFLAWGVDTTDTQTQMVDAILEIKINSGFQSYNVEKGAKAKIS